MQEVDKNKEAWNKIKFLCPTEGMLLFLMIKDKDDKSVQFARAIEFDKKMTENLIKEVVEAWSASLKIGISSRYEYAGNIIKSIKKNLNLLEG